MICCLMDMMLTCRRGDDATQRERGRPPAGSSAGAARYRQARKSNILPPSDSAIQAEWWCCHYRSHVSSAEQPRAIFLQRPPYTHRLLSYYTVVIGVTA